MPETAASAVNRLKPKTPGDLSTGNRVGIIGDSLAGDKATIASTGILTAEGRWFMWACFLSDGHAWHAGNMGVNGQNSTQILARFQADVLDQSPRWDKVAIHSGTNDLPTGTMQTARDNLVTMVAMAKNAGIEPIISTITPGDGRSTADKAVYDYYYQWQKWYAGCNGIALIDLWKPAVDVNAGDHWRSGYSGDTLHPIPTGAQALGLAVKDEFAALFPRTRFPLHSLSGQGANLIANGCFQGAPTSWTLTGNGSGTATASLVAADGTTALGNWYHLVMSGTAGSRDFTSSTITTTSGVGFAVGDRLAFAGKIKTTGFAAGGSYVLASVLCNNGALGTFYAIHNLSLDIDVQFYVEFVVPAGTTTLNARMSSYAVNGSGGQGTVEAAQFTLLNMTRMGFA